MANITADNHTTTPRGINLTAPAPMTNPALWQEIHNYEIDDPQAVFSFSQRLMRENLGWTYDFTVRVINEYKRFMYLGCISGPVTPSDQVDQAWHLHLIYTRQYEDFCKTLGRTFHHGPTRGGQAEDDRYLQLYEHTLSLYRREFGQEPPADIWPAAEERFKPIDFKRVDLTNHWVVPVGDFKALWQIMIKTMKTWLRL